jgi:hypothetical protein
MEGWRQGRLGSKQELTGWKRRRKTFLQEGRRKTYLTLTGLLMEGLTLLLAPDPMGGSR